MPSSVAEIAREEAERAEAEQPDVPEAPETPETPEAPETSPEPTPPPDEPQPPAEPLTEAKAESIFKSLERWKGSNEREVEKRAGPMFGDLVPCPACVMTGPAPGFIFAQLPEPEQSIRRQTVIMALGGEAEIEYPDDEGATACEACHALGKLKTGSKVQGQETRICPSCNGQGWKPVVSTAVPVFPAAPPIAAPQPFAGVSPNGLGPDQWGRAPGQERYGQHPSIGGW